MNQADRCSVCGGNLGPDDTTEVCLDCRDKATSTPAEASRDDGGRADPFAVTVRQVAGFVPPTPEVLNPHFSQIEVLELLGQGGMGAVYKARQIKLDRVVALKIIHPESADNAAFQQRFQREAQLLAKLNHSHIVGIHDFGEVSESRLSDELGAAETWYYFVMEFVEGCNLRDLMRRSLSEHEALAIFRQVCEGLQYAHEEGVVHRDIKPENILIDARGRVKIADFGLAKFAMSSSESHSLTQTHQVMGTPRYMAPEQLQGSKSVDQRADIYALGVVFYEMLTGELPLGRFDPPSQKCQVDPCWDRLVLKTLEQSPDRRYQTVTEMLKEIAPLSANPSSDQATQVLPNDRASQSGPLESEATRILTPSLSREVSPEIERRVKWPGLALMINGFAGLLPTVGLFISGLMALRDSGTYGESPVMGIVFLLLSLGMLAIVTAVVWGGWNLITLDQYRFALLGSFLGQPLGIWGLITLSRPEIRNSFQRQPRPMIFSRFVLSPLPWIGAMALLGIWFTFQTWASMPSPVKTPAFVGASGLGWWQGMAVCFGFGGILLIVTFSAGMQPVPYARPLALAVFGAGIFAATGHFITQLRSGSLPVQPLMEAAKWGLEIEGERPETIRDAQIVASTGSAPELILMLTTGLFVLIAIDFRRAMHAKDHRIQETQTRL